MKTPQITAAILFILGPVTEMIGSVSQFFRCNDAVHHIREIERRLDSMAVNGANGVNGASPATPTPDLAGFQSLACEEVTFRYKSPQGGNDSFGIGPISLNVKPGEILFIVGGNGSGKSTFLKLLTGLYAPATGLIRLDGRVITEETLADYRSLFSPVFTDFHLFDRLYGLGGVDPALTQELLNQTELADKTGIVDGRFTNLNLSTGQKKRLALTVALLEQRPILVFDEVAADQDPQFRKQLYETRFKEWQRAGKTIIAVTHDDAYFQVADRVIKLEYGRIASGQTWG
jgi:putative ATP-binding cassette transporter